MISIKLIQISSKYYKFLYNLLSERKQFESISHKKLPSYTDHVKFIKSKPYSKWLLIQYNEKMVGSVYLSKNNEIAIWIKKNIKEQKMKIQKKVLQEILTEFRRKKYFANINPRNKKIINFYKKNGFKLIYSTFQLDDKNDVRVKPDNKKKIGFYKKNGYKVIENVYMLEKNL
tara:strand:- start:352 stop:870 length:519 start_codon:yes stop_codon:yes gene_type:complete